MSEDFIRELFIDFGPQKLVKISKNVSNKAPSRTSQFGNKKT